MVYLLYKKNKLFEKKFSFIINVAIFMTNKISTMKQVLFKEKRNFPLLSLIVKQNNIKERKNKQE